MPPYMKDPRVMPRAFLLRGQRRCCDAGGVAVLCADKVVARIAELALGVEFIMCGRYC